MFVGLHAAGIPVSVVFNNDGTSTEVYIGTVADYFDVLDSLLKGCFPQIKYETNRDRNIALSQFNNISVQSKFGGYLKGNPTGEENFSNPFQLDSIIKGMSGKPWSICIFAKPVSKSDTVTRHQYWLTEATKCSELSEVSFSNNDNGVEAVT